jgi:hypothetical protein
MPAFTPPIDSRKILCEESRALREVSKIIRQQCKEAIAHSIRIHARILKQRKSK